MQFIRWSDLEKHKPDWDSFIIGGSGYILLDKFGNTSSRLSEDIDYFIRNNINPILFGIGVNLPLALSTSLVSIENHQLLSATTEGNLRELLSIARNISVRDFTTKEVLSRYTSKPIAMIGDPALHFGELEGINHTEQTDSDSKNLIGLNFSFHGPHSTRLLKRNLPLLISAIRLIREEHNCGFRYFCHYNTDLVIAKLLILYGIETEVIEGDPKSLTQAYSELSLNIAGMLHSCILAHSVDTPAIALAYDIKHRSFMELFNLEFNCLAQEDFSPTILVERVRSIMRNQSAYKKLIIDTRRELRLVTDNFIRTVFY